jgi:hypothetical protein
MLRTIKPLSFGLKKRRALRIFATGGAESCEVRPPPPGPISPKSHFHWKDARGRKMPLFMESECFPLGGGRKRSRAASCSENGSGPVEQGEGAASFSKSSVRQIQTTLSRDRHTCWTGRRPHRSEYPNWCSRRSLAGRAGRHSRDDRDRKCPRPSSTSNNG